MSAASSDTVIQVHSLDMYIYKYIYTYTVQTHKCILNAYFTVMSVASSDTVIQVYTSNIHVYLVKWVHMSSLKRVDTQTHETLTPSSVAQLNTFI